MHIGDGSSPAFAKMIQSDAHRKEKQAKGHAVATFLVNVVYGWPIRLIQDPNARRTFY